MVSGKVAGVLKQVLSRYGKTQAERLERAADEVNLDRWNPKALRQLFGSEPNAGTGSPIQNIGLLASMKPSDFENYARPLQYPNDVPYHRFENVPQRSRPPESEQTLDAYLKNLRQRTANIGLDEPGQLWLKPGEITEHEGRHRMRMLAQMNDEKALVNILPMRAGHVIGEPDEVLQRLKEIYTPEGAYTKFIPQELYHGAPAREPVMLPPLYAQGGVVPGFAGGDLVKKGLGVLRGLARDTRANDLMRARPEESDAFLPAVKDKQYLAPDPRLQRPLIEDANKIAYPGVYKTPRQIAQEAADLIERRAPDLGRDSPLFEVFGVQRGDLPDISRSRWNYMPTDEPPKTAPPKATGSAVTEKVFTPANIQHYLDVIDESSKHQQLYDPSRYWYTMDPAWDAARKAGADPDFLKRLNTNMGFFSMKSSPVDEIARGIPANYFANQGRAGEFARHLSTPADMRLSDFPSDMLGIPGHTAHKTQTIPYLKYAETGDPGFAKDTVKVPHYIAATDPGSPFLGNFVADSHNARGLKYPDVRVMKTPADITGNMSGSEFWDALPHYQKMAKQVGMSPTEMQALTWNAFGPQTGVDVIGKPKVELLAEYIKTRAAQLGLPVDTARDLILTGKQFAEGGEVEDGVQHFAGGNLVKRLRGALSTVEHLAEGKPKTVKLPGVGEIPSYPIKEIEDIGESFAKKQGNEYPISAFPKFDEDRARKIAEAYEAMSHDPHSPEVKRAYQALIDETMDQYKALEPLGLNFEFLKPGEGNPYKTSPSLGYHDLLNQGRMKVFPTEGGFGSVSQTFANPLETTRVGRIGDLPDATANDAFRIVHDVYGHYGPGNPYFRAPGEDRAWRAHSRLYSPEALPAATTELRGQNSWVNFGPYAERNKRASQDDTVYADQKVNLLPSWVWDDYRKAEGGEVVDLRAERQKRGILDPGLARIIAIARSMSNPVEAKPSAEIIPLPTRRADGGQVEGDFTGYGDAIARTAAMQRAKLEMDRQSDFKRWDERQQPDYWTDMLKRIGKDSLKGGASTLSMMMFPTYPHVSERLDENVNRALDQSIPTKYESDPEVPIIFDPQNFITGAGIKKGFDMGRGALRHIGKRLGFAPGGAVEDDLALPTMRQPMPDIETGVNYAHDFVPGATDEYGDLPTVGMQQQKTKPLEYAPLPQSGGGGSKGSGIGALLGPIGAIAGSFIPGVGTAIGGAAGNLLGQMVGAKGGYVDDEMLNYGVMNYAEGGQTSADLWPDIWGPMSRGDQAMQPEKSLQQGSEGLGGLMGGIFGPGDPVGGLLSLLLGGRGGDKGAGSGDFGDVASYISPLANIGQKIGLFADGGQVDPYGPTKKMIAALMNRSMSGELFEPPPELPPRSAMIAPFIDVGGANAATGSGGDAAGGVSGTGGIGGSADAGGAADAAAAAGDAGGGGTYRRGGALRLCSGGRW